MHPETALRTMIVALSQARWGDAAEAAAFLIGWLGVGGTPPYGMTNRLAGEMALTVYRRAIARVDSEQHRWHLSAQELELSVGLMDKNNRARKDP